MEKNKLMKNRDRLVKNRHGPFLIPSEYDLIPHVACYHPSGIFSMATTKNWRWMYTGGQDGLIRRYDFYTSMQGKQTLVHSQRHGFVESLNKSGMLISSFENEESEEDIKINQSRLSPVYSLAVQSEGVWGLTGLKSGAIKLWSLRVDEGKNIATLRGHKKAVSVLKLCENERSVLSGSWDSKVHLWDLETGDIKRSFLEHSTQISGLQLHPCDPNMFITSTVVGDCYLFDIRQENRTASFRLQNAAHSWICSVCWNPEGTKVYCGRRNSTVDEWDAFNGKLSKSLKIPAGSGPVTNVTCLKDGKSLICASADNMRLWNLAEEANEKGRIPFQIIAGHQAGIISEILINEDLKFMASASGNREWDGNTDKLCIFYEIRKIKITAEDFLDEGDEGVYDEIVQ